MAKLIVKIDIPKYEDRQKIISALTENQIKAWVDVNPRFDDRAVCFEIDEAELIKEGE